MICSDADQNVLRRVDTLSSGYLKDEVRKENQSQEKKDIFEGAADGLIRVRNLNE